MNNRYLLTLFLGASLLTISCDTDDILPTSVSSNVATVAPSYPTNQGFLQLINTVTTASFGVIGVDQEVRAYSAVAFVSDKDGNSINVGDVIVEDTKLSIGASNVYNYASITDPIQPNDVIDWEISGSADFDAANLSSSKRVPKIYTSVTKVTSISLSGYNANIKVHDADSTLVMIADAAGKSVIKTFSGTDDVGNFSQEELSVLTATSSGFVQLTPYNFEVRNVNGQDIVVGTQSTYTYAGVELK